SLTTGSSSLVPARPTADEECCRPRRPMRRQRAGAGLPKGVPMLGIDVSKDQLTCALLDPTSKQLVWERTVPNSAAGITQLLLATPSAAPWVLEPTGRYSAPI